ncbi:hypothetical protein RB195_014176 [Necator americanus]|uniref:Uncharacterized protein n=1 Tax=Necator americanus TaxID=51031 RepID=A0ABR1DZC0_NECAM
MTDAVVHGLNGPCGSDWKEPETEGKPLRKVRLTRFGGGEEPPLEEEEDVTSTSPEVAARVEEIWGAVGVMERFSIDAVKTY